ncbi:MAG: hypothetical protein AAGG01_06740 [Planctomycetota bacterium]
MESTIQNHVHQRAGALGGEVSHGDAVIEALSAPTRLMIAAVLIVNLSLGLWLVRSSDFTGVQPQGASVDKPRSEAALGDRANAHSVDTAPPRASRVALGESALTSN